MERRYKKTILIYEHAKEVLHLNIPSINIILANLNDKEFNKFYIKFIELKEEKCKDI